MCWKKKNDIRRFFDFRDNYVWRVAKEFKERIISGFGAPEVAALKIDLINIEGTRATIVIGVIEWPTGKPIAELDPIVMTKGSSLTLEDYKSAFTVKFL